MKFGLIVIITILIGFYFRHDNPTNINYLLATLSIVVGAIINLIKIPE